MRWSLYFNKVAASVRSTTSLQKRPQHRWFPMNFPKFLRTPFLNNTSGRLCLFLQLMFEILLKLLKIIYDKVD